jgi:hypothetical protein
LKNVLIMNGLQIKLILLWLFLTFGFLIVHGQIIPRSDSLSAEIERACLVTHQDARAVNTWWWGWLTGYSAATLGQGIAGVLSEQRSTRQDMLLGAATTLIGAAGQFFTPVQPVRIRKTPKHTVNSTVGADSLNECWEYLQRMSRLESKGRGWQMHLASGAVNVSSGLITWLGFKRTFKDGLWNFALNTVITEAQIWSQPVRAKKHYSMILQQQNQAGISHAADKPVCAVYAGAYAGRFCIAIHF